MKIYYLFICRPQLNNKRNVKLIKDDTVYNKRE